MKITLTDGTTMEMSVEEYEVFAKITKTAEVAEEEADTLEYDGVTYRKVCGREPEVGDYVVYEESPCICVKSGKPYVIESIDKWNDPQITDEEGDVYDTANDVFVVYEKVAGETEEKAEADELQVGDFAEVLEGGNGFSRKGDVVSITEKDSATVLYKIKHLNGKFAGWKTADGLRKIPVTYYEGKPYREVDRMAEKGELIKVVSAELAFGKYEDGDVLTTEKLVGSGLFARNSAGKRVALWHKEYVVLEPLKGTRRYGDAGNNRQPNIDMDSRIEYVIVSEPDAKGRTALITYADGTTQTLVNVKSIEVDTEGAR